MIVEQTEENKYLFILTVTPKDNDEQNMNNNPQNNNLIMSQVELNPEDLVVIRKFMDVYIYLFI